MPYGIRAMEAYEGDNSDHYSGPAIDGSRAGFFSANVNKLENRPSWEMESTLLHEAVPGHHLQIARAQELKGLPLFRRSGGNTAYVEGWALHAERLGYDMGFYNDPYQNLGRLDQPGLVVAGRQGGPGDDLVGGSGIVRGGGHGGRLQR